MKFLCRRERLKKLYVIKISYEEDKVDKRPLNIEITKQRADILTKL